MIRSLALTLTMVGLSAHALDAQTTDADRRTPVAAQVAPSGTVGDGGTEPSVSRDSAGAVTVRATRLIEPLRVDGRLDEPVYADVPGASDLVQLEPKAGEPSTEQTEFWITFDDKNLYVSVRCWDSHPQQIIATEMRRDTSNTWFGNDNITFTIDPVFDRRNGAYFVVSPLGGRNDGEIANEKSIGMDWNPVWTVKTGRFADGWTLEAAIPFKSLRYRTGAEQVWGFNLFRSIRAKNEFATLTRLSNALLPQDAFPLQSQEARLVGLVPPPPSSNFEVKPYVLSSMTTDRTTTPAVSNDGTAKFGFDGKYGITKSVTLDFTYNTDFAQVEADEQQVNLTRFSLFFPEKREFFLENQGTLSFGGAAPTAGGVDETPLLFYSRRIGLNAGRLLPLEAGGRLTGRTGRYSFAMMALRTGEESISASQPTNFAVLRVRRDVLRRSSIGALFTDRSISQVGLGGRNQVYGVDGLFAFFQNLTINTFWAQTRTPGLERDAASYRGQLNYAGDRYGLQLDHLLVGKNFNPEVGFASRTDIRRDFAQIRFSPRPASIKAVRKFSWIGSTRYIEDGAGRVQTRNWTGQFITLFQSSDQFSLTYNHNHELIPRPFSISSKVTVPSGEYDFNSVLAAFSFGQQRRLFGNMSAERGTFYGGTKTTLSVTGARMMLTRQLSAEPNFSINQVRLPFGSFTTRLIGPRTTYTVSPSMFVSAFIQYNSDLHAVVSNVRFRWEYQPGSELFAVYNEGRSTLSPPFDRLSNRTLVVKVNRLLRF